MNPLITDNVIAATVTGCLALVSIILPIYLRKRVTKKISAEEFIEKFMKRQAEEIAHKDMLLAARDLTIIELEKSVKRWSQRSYKYEVMVRELKVLLKRLRAENALEKKQNNAMRLELKKLKDTYESIYAKKFVEAVKADKLRQDNAGTFNSS
jgi:hypothetical protein